jgi:hypothetical protein
VNFNFARRRRLRFEQLETKIAPGAFLPWGIGATSFAAADETLAATWAERTPHDVEVPATEERRESPGHKDAAFSKWHAPHFNATDANSALESLRRATNRTTTVRSIAPSAAPASLGNWHSRLERQTPPDRSALAAILKTSTLRPPTPAMSGSGGGGSTQSGGAAGPSARTSFPATGGSSSAPTFAAPQPAVANSAAIDASATPTAPPQTGPRLELVDATGAPIEVPLNNDTLVVGAATWCGATKAFVAALNQPGVSEQLAGLRVIFAFGDEGGSGPGGVQNAEFLNNLPGEVAFLTARSVQPERLPSAYNSQTGQFDILAVDAVNAWANGSLVSGASCGNKNQAALAQAAAAKQQPAQDITQQRELRLTDASGAAVQVVHDNNTLVIGAATWCPYCAQLKEQLNQPEARSALEGLRIVFAFGNEGGNGPGGTANADFLRDLPGEALVLAPESVQPPSYPSAYNPASGQFDADAEQSIINWLANQYAERAEQAQSGQSIGTGSQLGTIPGDFTGDNRVDAADYVVWRKTLGMTGPNLAADADNNELIDQLDYDIWRANFGNELITPGAFYITGPTGIQTQEDNVISWDASAGATSYRFLLSKHADLSFPLYNEIVSGTSKAVNVGNGEFYVGVTAINTSGETPATNQGISFVVQLPPVDQLIFVTTTRYFVTPTAAIPPLATSFGSAAVADYHCTWLAAERGLLDEPWDYKKIYFRALLTEGSAGITTRAGLVEDVYYNTAGQVVASTRADLLSGSHTASILAQTGQTLTGLQPVWTGALPDGSPSPNKCSNWSSTSGQGAVGNLNGVGTQWLNVGQVSCGTPARLYCVGNVKGSAKHEATFDNLPDSSPAPAAYGENYSSDQSIGTGSQLGVIPGDFTGDNRVTN